MTFHSIVKQWCEEYKPIAHSERNKRFLLTDSYAGMVEMAKGIANVKSPCVVMESVVEGYMKGGRVFRSYPVYFFVRAEKMADGDDAAVAKEEAWQHAKAFVAWLRWQRPAHHTDNDWMGINLDENIDISTVGPIENGWFAVLIQFERDESTSLCIDPNMYINSEEL